MQCSERLEARHISFCYDMEHKAEENWILKDVNLSVEPGERVALVGPSGCGKSTLAKILSGYEKPIEGEALWAGSPLPKTGYCPVQLIYQHPEQAVNPRWKMRKTLMEGGMPDEDIMRILGIEKEWLTRWPSELSGGELQRFCIARVLGPKTRFVICDEISTMLDSITQAQVWRKVIDVSVRRKLGLLVITHNMALAEQVCTRVIKFCDINNCSSPTSFHKFIDSLI